MGSSSDVEHSQGSQNDFSNEHLDFKKSGALDKGKAETEKKE